MKCNNIRCPYYKKPEKPDWAERYIGMTVKEGQCKHSYCKLKLRGSK